MNSAPACSTPQQLGAGLGEAEEGASGNSRSPASAGAEMLGWEQGNCSSTQPFLMGEGGFFFPPSLPRKGGRLVR